MDSRRRIGVVFPSQHLGDGAGAAEVLRQQAAWLARNGYHATLILAAPSFSLLRRDRAARAEALRQRGGELGFEAVHLVGLSARPSAWRANLILLAAVLLRRLRGRLWTISDDLKVSTALAHWKPEDSDVQAVNCVICNYLSGMSLADALAPAKRQLLVLHDFMGADDPQPVSRAIGEQRHLLALNHEEAAKLAGILGRPCAAGLPLDDSSSPTIEAAPGSHNRGPDLLFVGGAHPPNVEGLAAFIRDCFQPHLAKKGITLAVAGAVGPAVHKIVGATPGVEMMGRVADLRPLYATARLVIVPLLSGTGVSIKTLEAISFGKTVLTTPIGLRGLGPKAGPSCPPPFDARWADQIETLLENAALAERWRTKLRLSLLGHTLADELTSKISAMLQDLEETTPIASERT